MLMTITQPASGPEPDLPTPPMRPAPSDRLPRAAVAAAIASLPLLIPPGPANTAPADVVIFIAIAAALLWAGSTRQILKFPYLLGMGTMVVAGSLAALFSAHAHQGAQAVAQDVFLLAWG